MAQLRQDYPEFEKRNTVILVLGPEDTKAFEKQWEANDFPFIGLPDPEHRVLDLYGQEVKLLKLGRMPAQMLIGIDGAIEYIHYGEGMSDITDNRELLAYLDSAGK